MSLPTFQGVLSINMTPTNKSTCLLLSSHTIITSGIFQHINILTGCTLMWKNKLEIKNLKDKKKSLRNNSDKKNLANQLIIKLC